jgi:hypothetical protein
MRTAAIFATTLSLAVVAVVAAEGQARADTARVWAAAKAALPADAKLVIGVDIAAVQKTQVFQAVYPKLHDSPDANQILGMMKDDCKLDPLAVVRGVVVAMSADQEEGAIYLAVSGIDRAKLSSCFQRVAQARHKDAKIAVKQNGDITELTRDSETAYIGWIGKDVIVVSKHGEDRASLVKWMGGKGAFAKSDVAKTLAKVNTGAPIWGAGAIPNELQPGMKLKLGYGAVTTAKGSLAVDFHAVMESADQAIAAADLVNVQLDVVKSGNAPVPPDAVALLKTVTVAADKDEVRIKANVDEKDVLTAVQHGLAGLGGP